MSISPLNKKKVVLIAHIYSAYNQHKIYKFFLWHTHAVLKTHECASVHVMKEPVRNICNIFSAIARAIYRGSLEAQAKDLQEPSIILFKTIWVKKKIYLIMFLKY